MSHSIFIAPEQLVVCNSQTYRITHLLDLQSVLAANEQTGESKRLYIKDLDPVELPANPSLVAKSSVGSTTTPDESFTTGQTQKEVELGLIADADWQEAQRRFAMIRPLLVAPRRTREMVEEQARVGRVHFATLYRWIDAYSRSERVSSLLPVKRNGGRGKSRLSKEQEAIMAATIEDFYLNKQKRSIQKTCSEVARRCRHAGLNAPHPNTIRNRIALVSDKLKLERRQSVRVARETYAHIRGNFPGADYPLSVVQIDHTLLDIMLVDGLNRLSIGRPFITVTIDVFSRMVCGFYVSLDPPGNLATGLAIANSILPKEKWLARQDIGTNWSVWGLPRAIHADNAKEFRGNMLRRACEEYGIDLTWRPVARPNYGGHIERLMGTIAREIHALPGTTFSNVKQRGDYDSEAQAVMTLKELEKYLATFFVEVYHQRVHSALKTSPIKKYEEGIFGSAEQLGVGVPPRRMDEERLRLDFMPFEERTIQQYGVVIDDVHYFHDVLRPYINASDPSDSRRKRKFVFKRDPRDISVIYFYDPELNQYRAIPYRDTSRPAISVWELREARRHLEAQGRTNINEQLIFEAYEKLREQEQTAIKETKRVRRQRVKREHHRETARPLIAPITPHVTTDISLSSIDIKPFEEIEEL
ncbi:MAG: DDE-type integrase/transposase/recombinase [Pyrinomonadaceae bacterium MAG19_C2-C3]|nr:DDE-type integrase/transposase/recombinase [Pyrinomonadaceae bacterium MAG19_C2-C3]